MKKKIKKKNFLTSFFNSITPLEWGVHQVSSTHELQKALLWEPGHLGQRTGHITSRYVAASHWSMHWSCHALFSHTQQNYYGGHRGTSASNTIPALVCREQSSGAFQDRVDWATVVVVCVRARERRSFLCRAFHTFILLAWKRIHRIHVLRILFTFTSLRGCEFTRKGMIVLESSLSEFSSGSLD
jgi:hypothetical protein